MQQDTLKGKVVVITGASSGFGKGSALEFARQGAVLGLAARRVELMEELGEECRRLGTRVLVVPTDVSKAEQVANLAQRVSSEFGRIDVWVNNAGAGAIGRFEEVPLADHIQVIETDLLGTLYGSYFAMQRFRQQNYGILINISSVLGKIPNPYYASYAAAKHGVNGLSAALRLELEQSKAENIHVCTVMPTSTDTPFFEHAANFSGHEFQPTPPVYDPKDVIEVIVKLATKPEAEVGVGSAAKMAILAHSIAPQTTESQFGKKTHKKLMEESPAAGDSEGGLREPSPVGTGVKGDRKK